jgi:hypothetical protein
MLNTRFEFAEGLVALPPSLGPTFENGCRARIDANNASVCFCFSIYAHL